MTQILVTRKPKCKMRTISKIHVCACIVLHIMQSTLLPTLKIFIFDYQRSHQCQSEQVMAASEGLLWIGEIYVSN